MTWRFFQIHLLTAVVGMLSAAVFIGLNLKVFTLPIVDVNPVTQTDDVTLSASNYYYMGWPAVSADRSKREGTLTMNSGSTYTFTTIEDSSYEPLPTAKAERVARLIPSTMLFGKPVLTATDVVSQDPDLEKIVLLSWEFRDHSKDLPSWNAHFHSKGIAINAVVALVMTLAAMIGIEWFLRRREAVKV